MKNNIPYELKCIVPSEEDMNKIKTNFEFIKKKYNHCWYGLFFPFGKLGKVKNFKKEVEKPSEEISNVIKNYKILFSKDALNLEITNTKFSTQNINKSIMEKIGIKTSDKKNVLFDEIKKPITEMKRIAESISKEAADEIAELINKSYDSTKFVDNNDGLLNKYKASRTKYIENYEKVSGLHDIKTKDGKRDDTKIARLKEKIKDGFSKFKSVRDSLKEYSKKLREVEDFALYRLAGDKRIKSACNSFRTYIYDFEKIYKKSMFLSQICSSSDQSNTWLSPTTLLKLIEVRLKIHEHKKSLIEFCEDYFLNFSKQSKREKTEKEIDENGEDQDLITRKFNEIQEEIENMKNMKDGNNPQYKAELEKNQFNMKTEADRIIKELKKLSESTNQEINNVNRAIKDMKEYGTKWQYVKLVFGGIKAILIPLGPVVTVIVSVAQIFIDNQYL
ncbi:MAG: hypothetical protein FWC41_08195 [Firmicutes bacterium]|nr:hypothetical protein [Bacillota bacterium]